MRSFGEVKELLVKLSIPYRIVEHPASHSTEESDAFIQGYEGCRSKTLVLANKKSTQFYMIIMDDKKRIEMDHLSNILKVKRLHFVSEERLEAMLGLSSGIVLLFGLVGTRYDNMHIYFDREMLEEHRIQTFHPNDNTKTLFIKMEACFTILEAQGYTYEVVDL